MFDYLEQQLQKKAKEYAKEKKPICQETEQAFIDGGLYFLQLLKELQK